MASEDMRDNLRRRVYTWSGNTPEARELDEQEWYLIPEDDGYVFKNARYGEYLYAASDSFKSGGKRSVFTWKNHDDLGREGIWKIAVRYHSSFSTLLNWSFTE